MPCGLLATSQSRSACVARTSSSLYAAIAARSAGRCGSHVVLVLQDCTRAFVDLVVASEIGELLHALQAVGLGADLNTVESDLVQVDERTCADEFVHLRFGTGWPSVRLQDGAFGVVVVIGVHIDELVAPCGEVGDQRRGRGGPPSLVVGPPGAEVPLPLASSSSNPKEPQTGFRSPEGMALEVTKTSPSSGRGNFSSPRPILSRRPRTPRS